MYFVLKRFFLAHFWQTFNKLYNLSICKEVLFHRPRKKTPCRLKQSLKTFPAICDMKINNSCKKLLEERTTEEKLQEIFSLAAIFVYSLARGKKTEH